jgi:hypothetical protein
MAQMRCKEVDFKDLFSRKRITKKVDPSLSDVIGAPSAPSNVEEKIVTPTSLSSTIESLADNAQIIFDSIGQLKDSIIVENSTDSVFKEYISLLEARFPKVVDFQQIEPTVQIDTKKLKAIHRDIYRRLYDPRAPYLYDLYALEHEAASIIHFWRDEFTKITRDTELYNSIDIENNIMNLAFDIEKRRLGQIALTTAQIAELKINPLSECAVDALVEGLFSSATTTFDSEMSIANQLRNFTKFLKNIRSAMAMTLIFENADWENAFSLVEKSTKVFAEHIDEKLRASGNLVLSAGAYPFVDDFLNVFFTHLQTTNCFGQVGDFYTKANRHFINSAKYTEESLVGKVSKIAEENESRNIRLSKSNGSVKTKQYILIIDTFISTISHAINTELRTWEGMVNYDTSMLRQSIRKTLLEALATKSSSSPSSDLLKYIGNK